jgi:RNA 2',3'-cyclic 3'-phosphodiesterase
MTQRLFFALALPDDVASELSTLQWGPSGARWTLPDQLHLTLRFVGETAETTVTRWQRELTELDVAPLRLQLQGVGFFPPRGAPRVLWAGVRDDAALQTLRTQLDRRLAKLGLPPSGERLRPHVTLGRLRHSDDAEVAAWLTEHGLMRSAPFTVHAVRLMRSVPGSAGSEYTVIRNVALSGAPTA